MSSLFQTMTLSTITLDEALQLLPLPRIVGAHPDDGGEIVAANGRYGPFLKWGEETRSLDTEEQLLTVTLDEAVKVLAQPKKFGRRKAAPAPPLKELGNDPVSEKPVVVKDGRFGPYVTDGETNASRCARATPSRTSRSSGPPSCCRSAATPAPAKKARKGGQEGAGQEGREEEGAGEEGRRKKAAPPPEA